MMYFRCPKGHRYGITGHAKDQDAAAHVQGTEEDHTRESTEADCPKCRAAAGLPHKKHPAYQEAEDQRARQAAQAGPEAAEDTEQ